MNKGVRLATGDLIALIHADDYYSDPSVISSVFSKYLRHPDALWLTGGIEIVDENGKILQEIPVREHSLFDTERWVGDRLPYVDIVFPRLSSRNHRWRTFVMRILRGQIMVVPMRQPSRR
jgi:glycosyltransferase involved in cell wall biosynthesis